MKNFKEKALTILLIVLIGLPILLVILSAFDMLSAVFSTIGKVFVTLSNGSWLQGVFCTLFVIVGLINLIRGMFTASDREEALLASLPDWAKNLIVAVSFIGTLGFIFVLFDLLT